MMFRKTNYRYMAPAEGDEGGGAESSGGAVGTGNEARVAMLESINDALDAGDRGEELAHVNDDDTTEPFRTETKPPGEEVAPKDETAVVVEESTPAKVKIKVNGEELELTQEQLIERAQKVESADRYLAEAAAAKRAAAPPKEEPKTEEVDYKALVRAIQVGTEEEAEAALRKLQTTQARPPTPMDDVSRVVDERLKFQDAMKAFSTEYADILSDPKLNKMAQQMDEEMLANGDIRSYASRYTEIGENLRGWVTKLGGGKKEEPAKVDTTRQERKEAAPTTPTAAAGKNAPPKTESDEDDNPTSVISKMAAARGGPQWMRA